MAYADKFGKQEEVVNLLFRAYFEEQKNLGDLNLLIEVAQQAGLPDVRDPGQRGGKGREPRKGRGGGVC